MGVNSQVKVTIKITLEVRLDGSRLSDKTDL
jgi:hypothetical protein